MTTPYEQGQLDMRAKDLTELMEKLDELAGHKLPDEAHIVVSKYITRTIQVARSLPITPAASADTLGAELARLRAGLEFGIGRLAELRQELHDGNGNGEAFDTSLAGWEIMAMDTEEKLRAELASGAARKEGE